LGGAAEIDCGTATGTALAAAGNRADVSMSAQRLKPAPQIAPERIFDFNLARKAGKGCVDDGAGKAGE